MRFLPSKIYVPIHYEYHTGKKLSFDCPIEFNEKIQWMKIFYRPKILTQLVDKYAVRDYVEEKIGGKYLNDIYGVYDKAEDIPFETLPNKFVIKATHASSYNLIVSDKTKIHITDSIKLLNKWLHINQYYRMGQEWAYKDVPPKLIVEKFLEEDRQDSLIDYKFYCFNGKAKLLEVHLDRAQKHKRGFYDLKFNRLPYRYVSIEKSISTEVKRPENFEKMRNLSEVLADKFPFVRVDFYSIKGKIIFGEMTFYPSDGRKDLIPEKYNSILGSYIKLPELEKRHEVFTLIS
jgi:hypothetical protein